MLRCQHAACRHVMSVAQMCRRRAIRILKERTASLMSLSKLVAVSTMPNRVLHPMHVCHYTCQWYHAMPTFQLMAYDGLLYSTMVPSMFLKPAWGLVYRAKLTSKLMAYTIKVTVFWEFCIEENCRHRSCQSCCSYATVQHNQPV